MARKPGAPCKGPPRWQPSHGTEPSLTRRRASTQEWVEACRQSRASLNFLWNRHRKPSLLRTRIEAEGSVIGLPPGIAMGRYSRLRREHYNHGYESSPETAADTLS